LVAMRSDTGPMTNPNPALALWTDAKARLMPLTPPVGFRMSAPTTPPFGAQSPETSTPSSPPYASFSGNRRSRALSRVVVNAGEESMGRRYDRERWERTRGLYMWRRVRAGESVGGKSDGRNGDV
jgi:hypothetical protein